MAEAINDLCVWVVGGGFSGLSTAAALRNIAGVKTVIVLERSSDDSYYRSESIGASAQLGPNGLLALRAIYGQGMVDRIVESGQRLTNIGIVLPNRTIMLIPETSHEGTGLPQVILPWKTLRQFLQEQSPRDSIHTGIGSNICGYREDESGRVYLVDDNMNRVGPDNFPNPSLVVAADGIDSPFQSLVRIKETVLVGPDSKAIRKSNLHDNGRVNIKAVVDVPLDYDKYGMKDVAGNSIPAGTALAYNSPDGSIICFADGSGDNLTYWAISVADHVDEAGNVTKYFCNSNPEYAEAQKRKVLQMLRDLNSPDCQFCIDLLEETPAETIYSSRSEQLTLVGPTFVSYDNKVVLVGDAAHAMSPSFGQGANFAFEDAVTLAHCIQTTPTVTEALNEYSNRRVGRCDEMFHRSEVRLAKQREGEHTEDVFKWICQWKPPL